MAHDMPIIRLWQLEGVGLIVAHPSGVVYSNQTGGYATDHREQEGAFVPLRDPDVDQAAQLEAHFIGPKWRGHCYNGIDEETAAFVDGVLAASSLTRRLTVDRARLRDSDEAWIYVVFAAGVGEDYWDLFSRFPSGAGVLTWENSD